MGSQPPASQLAIDIHEKVYGECAHSYDWVGCSCEDKGRNGHKYGCWHDDECDGTCLPACEAGWDTDYPAKVCRKCGAAFSGLRYSVGDWAYAPAYDTDMNLALDVMLRFKMSLDFYEDNPGLTWVVSPWDGPWYYGDDPAALICEAALAAYRSAHHEPTQA